MTDATPVRWGVLATGGIAHVFAGDLQFTPDATLAAVGARSQESADAFGNEFSIPRRHGNYEDLVNDSEVDAVYIATQVPEHVGAARAAIAAGKAVLLEKPFTLNADEALELIDAARDRGTFLMEAMWTRFLPHMIRVREILASGMLGEIVSVTADFGGWLEPDPTHRLFDRARAGGALLDLGIYPVSLASMVLGAPERITAVSHPAPTGVDLQTSAIFQYAGGRHALLTTTLSAVTQSAAAINGTAARLQIARPFYAPTTFEVIDRDDIEVERYDAQPAIGFGLWHEAAEVGRCLRAGLTESPIMPLAETLSIMQSMDEIRAQIGLTFP